jgi:hypothetical protein
MRGKPEIVVARKVGQRCARAHDAACGHHVGRYRGPPLAAMIDAREHSLKAVL